MSPSVFLAAAIQRTSKIRIGPLVYVLPLHHPLRLYEEICMLDHLSGGRLTVGVGRGGALIEHQRLGVDPALAPAMYHEAFSVLMRAFEADVVDFEGRFYNYKDYVVQMKPVQRPHPPLWYGAPNADAIAWAAAGGVNVVSLGPGARARAISDRYREEWKKLRRDGARCRESELRAISSLPIPTARHNRLRAPPIRAGAKPSSTFGGVRAWISS